MIGQINIVILDGQLANPGDLSWDPIRSSGRLTVYQSTEEDQIIDRAIDADVLIINKVQLDYQHFDQLPKLKLVCLLATGFDNVNIEDASKAGITVCNAVGYGVDSVAQHVWALILSCTNKVSIHNAAIQSGVWPIHQWSFTLGPLSGLAQKTLGIYGFGKIGQKVAEIALAFGMEVIAHHKHPERDIMEGVTFVSMNELSQRSDILSLHAPLSVDNTGVINKSLLSLMKDNAILINTARGGLINEEDLKAHLLVHPDFMSALDVLSIEPAGLDHPLIGISNCILTPHNAWANIDARRTLIETVGSNIKQYLLKKPSNIVA